MSFVLRSTSTRVPLDAIAPFAGSLARYACEITAALGLIDAAPGVRADRTPGPSSERVIQLVDDDGQAPGAAGYHVPGGDIVIEVGAILDAGGDLSTLPLSVTSVLAHEIAEEIGDTPCNVYAEDAGRLFAYELCDATEADTFTDDAGVSLANYLLPSFFDPQGAAPFDRMGVVTGPFQTRPGGYQLVLDGGVTTEVYGQIPANAERAKLARYRSARRDGFKSRRAILRGMRP